ncbi:tyrosine-type recombinase/integrase [Rhodococcoides fascians]|uniref:tyrosine-type recombinase/integrase n=1 Tax=Rhodococcoides fascians TaxID=1828 RepID=UPI000B1589AE|nr:MULTISPECIES: tyrosine-type recombinase/integrase [Rhodococcus]
MSDSAITGHLAHLRRQGASEETIYQRRRILGRVSDYIGKPMVDATYEDLDRWQRSLRVCTSSIATYTSHVRALYEWLSDMDHITVNPTRNLVMPKIKPRVPRPIPEKDLEVALATARHDHQLFCWFLLAGYSGLRAGEISRIDRGDLREADDGGAYLKVHGKGGYERVVRIAPEVYAELALISYQRGRLFRGRDGEVLRPHRVSQVSSRHLAGVGLPYTLHTLRHRFATALCDLGADVRDVQHALGHSSLATTTQYVAHSARRGAGDVDRLGAGLAAMKKRQTATRKANVPT